MTEQNPSAHARPASGRRPGGVEHEHHPHHDNFTVVGNHLLQHPELSLTAIGLAVHIQSLPAGAPVGIKTLAGKFPEGEIRIAAALRELEEHGYLARTKERLQSGRVVTRTVFRSKPRAAFATVAEAARPAADGPASPAPAGRVDPVPATDPADPAAVLLARLRLLDSRLLLTERDVRRLAPAVTEWLGRGVPATAVERTLTAGLPQEPIRHPAAFLERRLTADLPPALPAAPRPSVSAPRRPDPLQTCDGCERAFRAPGPGRCRDCREQSAPAHLAA
ncbi:helix-turn-helix domain-containing protein [Streptomyces sp. M92]|uniref:helix-turn-helix domain-containing protein n=1 Tax=Streptomyces sp. M92 TaxID=2944250 RepID=UPI002349BED7|nr:helix-turn-helix domain-containing protein [Streptomyces sp. M92]WCN06819.1 helix-turn-helix domain-containing protein [Streptomyces sp. M92]